jgi:MtN3 and saliva related transmembrane protein
MVDYITVIGLLAGTLSIIAYLPQVWKTYTTKHTNDLSMKWLIINSISQVFWFTFGVLSLTLPVILTSSSILIMTICLIIMKRKYDYEN